MSALSSAPDRRDRSRWAVDTLTVSNISSRRPALAMLDWISLESIRIFPPLDVVGPYLAAGSGPEGLPDKVRPVPRTVSGEPPAELVIGRFHRDVVVDVAEPQGRHAAQVETV